MTISSTLKSLQHLNPLSNMSSLDAEEQKFQDEVNAVKQWWSDSRWRYTKR